MSIMQMVGMIFKFIIALYIVYFIIMGAGVGLVLLGEYL